MKQFVGMVVAYAALVSISPKEAGAALVVELSGTSGSSTVTYSLSGDLQAARDTSAVAFRFEVPGGVFPFTQIDTLTTGTGRFTNESTDQSSRAAEISFIQGSGSLDSLRIDTPETLTASQGDTFTASGSGTLTLRDGYTFDDFTTGSFDLTSGGRSGPEFVGVHTLEISSAVAVPEPSCVALASMTAVFLIARTRRKHRLRHSL